VGRGGTMNIGLAPDTRGILHEDDVRSLKGWKALMEETFGNNLLASHEVTVSASHVRGQSDQFSAARVLDGNNETYWACDDTAENPELVFEFREPVKFNVLSIREQIALGQRVDAFAVDTWNGNQWNEVGNATSIGNRRLLVLRNACSSKFRIRFTRASACPAISEVALFRAPIGLILGGKLTIIRTGEGMVQIRSTNPWLTIRYTTDGSEPTESSPLYTAPFPFLRSGTVKAFGYIENEPGARIPSVSTTFGIDRSKWRVVSVSLDSPFDNGGVAGVTKLLDDDPATFWQTYHDDKSLSAPPHEVVLDMGRSLEVAAFTFQPRMGKGRVQAIPDQFAFYLSQDGTSWTLAAEGEFANIKASPGMRCVTLPRPMSGRYLRFVAKHVIDDGNYVAVAGLGVVEA